VKCSGATFRALTLNWQSLLLKALAILDNLTAVALSNKRCIHYKKHFLDEIPHALIVPIDLNKHLHITVTFQKKEMKALLKRSCAFKTKNESITKTVGNS
jgi:hypothetical protein